MVTSRAAILLLAALVAGCAVQPSPMTNAELAVTGQEWATRAVEDSERLSKPVSLYEAMARALKHNLDARVEELDAVLKLRQLDLASADQLPQLVADVNATSRNNSDGSSSQSLLTGTQSLVSSTSTDRRVTTSDLNLSWNILDFGLSYFRAHQAADRALIGAENRRKALHALFRDVRTAFWRTAAADLLARRMRSIGGRMQTATLHVQELEEQGAVSPVFTLTYRREVLELKVEIQRLYAELAPAKIQLAHLMNVVPEPNFGVSGASNVSLQPFKLPSFDDMTDFALQGRPELRQAGYDKRINREEAQIALLELLPGVAPFISANADTNSFLYNPNWISAGAKASWNLMKIAAYPQRKAAVEAEANYLDKKALATAIAIMAEVEVSRVNYLQAREKFRIAQEYYQVESALYKQMASSHDAGAIGEHTLLRQEMRALLAEAKRNLAYADYQNAFGILFVTMGFDIADGTVDAHLPLEILAGALEADWRSQCKRASSMERRTNSSAILVRKST